MTTEVSPEDSRLTWTGLVGMRKVEAGWELWRLNPQEAALLHNGLVDRACSPAGVRLRFISDAKAVTVAFGDNVNPADSGFEIHCEGSEILRQPMDGNGTTATAKNPASGPAHWEIRMPSALTTLKALTLGAFSILEPWPDERPRWVTYGSSITHCRNTPYPSETWPSIVADTLGLNHTSLGFGGQCHLDPLVARVMRDRPADYLSMCIGINIYGSNSLGKRAFIPNLIGFIQLIREKHPATPLMVMSPIISCSRENAENKCDWTLVAMREAIQNAVATLRDNGDSAVHYQDGLEIFGEADAHLLPDDLHPNTEGYALMGERISNALVRHLGVGTGR